jgi:hypothetical protein
MPAFASIIAAIAAAAPDGTLAGERLRTSRAVPRTAHATRAPRTAGIRRKWPPGPVAATPSNVGRRFARAVNDRVVDQCLCGRVWMDGRVRHGRLSGSAVALKRDHPLALVNISAVLRELECGRCPDPADRSVHAHDHGV